MTQVDGSVQRWLDDNEDARSEVSSFARAPASEYGEFDDSKYVLRGDYEEEVEVSSEVAGIVEHALGAVAKAAQRKAVCQFRSQYVRGRMLDVPVYSRGTPLNQRFFKLEAFMELASIDDDVLIKQLSDGVVRSRVGARTGMGKTMKLPGKIAATCGLRVCQLELDAVMAATAMEYQKKLYGIPGGVRAWSRKKRAFLACMSYEEFRGVVLSGDCNRLFEDFDVFYMDEAHAPFAAVWAARQYFAAFAKPHNSLLVASATVSTTEDNNVSNLRAGAFKVEQQVVTLRQAMDSGRLIGEELRDRVMVFAPSDEAASLARAYYLDHGMNVFVLDSASVKSDCENVVRAFTSSSDVVPRVLIATQRFGAGYNFPVTRVVTSATRRVYELTADNCLVAKEIPIMQKEVVQNQGRAGRGLATGGGGWVMRGDAADPKEILAAEALEAYLSLVAAGIKPRPGPLDSAARVLPLGVDAGVARTILRVGLPPALTVRYLGSDGRFAGKYLEGIKLFTQRGELLRKSKDELPLNYDMWIDETVGEYYEGDETTTKVPLRVPFASPEGLKIAMHTISAVAERYLDLEYWDEFDDEDESDDEYVGVRTKAIYKALPRLPEPEIKKVDTSSVTTTFQPWTYNANPDHAAKQKWRRGMTWDVNGEARGAIVALMRAVEADTLGVTLANPIVNDAQHGGKVVYPLPAEEEGTIPIKSPGGGKILLVAKSTHDAFMRGSAMSLAQSGELLKELIEMRAIERFAKSTVFDNWSPAWKCWMTTFQNEETVRGWRDQGNQSEAVKLLSFLYERFRVEVLAVAASSNLYKTSLAGYFRSKPSVTKFVRAFREGRLPVAQTDTFVLKVLEIKDAYDLAVIALEKAEIYAPKLITKAQQHLPIRDSKRRMEVIDEQVVPPKKLDLSSQTVWRR